MVSLRVERNGSLSYWVSYEAWLNLDIEKSVTSLVRALYIKACIRWY